MSKKTVTKEYLYHKIQSNQLKKCKVRGCQRNRDRISSMCVYHSQRLHHWGHAEATPIKPREMEPEREAVREIVMLNLNSGHEGLLYGVSYFQRLLDDSFDNKPNTPCFRVFGSLKAKGTTGIDLLISVATAWHFYMNRMPSFLRTHKYLIYFVGHHLAYGSGVRMFGSIRRELGSLCWDNIRTLLISISSAVNRKRAESDHLQTIQAEPLEFKSS